MINIFAIILNWNQAALTIDCIKSLRKNKSKKYELKLVVVDNGSTDDSLTRIKKTGVEIIETSANFGFAKGNNIGMRYALDKNADYILVLNNDTEVGKNLLEKLLKPFEKDSKIAISSPKIYFAKGYEFHKDRYRKNDIGKVIWYAGGKIDWKNVYGKNTGVDNVDKGQYEKEKEIDFATGACFLVKREALKEVGLFNEKYFMYMEDMDLSLRMRHKNYKIIFVPKAMLWHKVAQSSGIGSDLNDYFISRNRLLFGMKYAKLRTKIALIKESLRIFIFGRHWQAVGVRDFYLKKFGKGSWQ